MTNSRALLGGRLGTAALLGILTLSGCGSESDTGAGSETENSASPTAETTIEPAEELTAADGSDYTACEDGRCEVLVTEPVELAFDTADGALTMNIIEVSADGISIDVIDPSGSTSGTSLLGACEAVITGTSINSSCYAAGVDFPEPEPEPGVLVLQTLGMTEDGTVLRIALG